MARRRNPRIDILTRGLAAAALLAMRPAVAAPPAVEIVGTASIKLQRITRLEGQERGPARVAVDALVDGCNGIRQSMYGLPPVAPPADALSRLDRRIVEKYFAGDRAATYITTTGLELVDFKRWSAAARGADKPPPPDCAKHELHDNRSGTIWRDGRRIQLRFDTRRAVSQPAPQDFTVRPLPAPVPVETLPSAVVGGQPCREVVAPTLVEFAGGKACLWAVFPFASYLNLPWALSAERSFGMPGKMIDTDTLIDAQRNRAIDTQLFEVPRDFSLAGG